MSDLKPRGVPIVLDGEERHFLFSLNTIDSLQDKYGKSLREIMDDLTKGEASNHALRDIVTVLLNDEAWRSEKMDMEKKHASVTEQEVGDMIGLDNYWDVLKAIFAAYGISLPEPDEDDDDPNPKSGQQSN